MGESRREATEGGEHNKNKFIRSRCSCNQKINNFSKIISLITQIERFLPLKAKDK